MIFTKNRFSICNYSNTNYVYNSLVYVRVFDRQFVDRRNSKKLLFFWVFPFGYIWTNFVLTTDRLYWRQIHCIEDRSIVLKTDPLYWRQIHCIEDRSIVLKTDPLYWRQIHCIDDRSIVLTTDPLYWRQINCIDDRSMLESTVHRLNRMIRSEKELLCACTFLLVRRSDLISFAWTKPFWTWAINADCNVGKNVWSRH